MRFEILVVVIQMLGFAYIWFKYDFKNAFLPSLLLFYGPAAVLANLSIGSATLPLGSAIALSGIMYTLKCSISTNLSYYALILGFSCIMMAIIHLDLYILAMTIHFLIYALCGLLLGNFVASRPETVREDFVKHLCNLGALGFLCVMLFRSFLVDGTGVIHFRDVGFGIIPVFVLFLVTLNNRFLYLPAASSFLYLVLSQTRSLLGVLVIGAIYGRKLLGLTKRKLLFSVGFVFSLITLILLVSLRYEIQTNAFGEDADLAQRLSLSARINAAVLEWDYFKASPVIGNGISYYSKEDIIKKSDENLFYYYIDEIAFNHVGIVSVIAQGGIVLLILVVGVPLYLILKLRRTLTMAGRKDKLMVACFLILICYLITFFVSGSPVRRDYNDAILYYFVIGYLMRYSSSMKVVEKST